MVNAAPQPRFPSVSLVCKLKIGSAPFPLMVHTENIGPGGIRVYLAAQVFRGTKIEMEIFLESGHIVKTDGIVIWTMKDTVIEKVSIDKYDTGIQFEGLLMQDKQKIYQMIEEINIKNLKKQSA